jgi:phage terminase large subunit GpA-like protein
MRRVLIRCPQCGEETRLSLQESSYRGPFRCWKCRGEFIITIKNGKLVTAEAVPTEELEKSDNMTR